MNARERLDNIKAMLGVKTDAELSVLLKTKKSNIDSWIKRDKIPEKWELFIRQMPYTNIINGNENIQISGQHNIISNNANTEYEELFELIKEYATPKMIKDFKEKLLKIKEINENWWNKSSTSQKRENF